jgi:myxalamid-type polyketide synthase MxaB
MAAAGKAAQQLNHLGIDPLSSKEAVEQTLQAVAHGQSRVLLIRCEWERFLEVVPAAAEMLSGLVRVEKRAAVNPLLRTTEETPALLTELRQEEPAKALRKVQSIVTTAVTRLMSMGGAGVHISATTPLMDQGMDSLMAVDLRNSLRQSFGLPLPVGAFFSYPSIDQLSGFLLEEIRRSTHSDKPATLEVTVKPTLPTALDVQQLDSLNDAELLKLIENDLRARS